MTHNASNRWVVVRQPTEDDIPLLTSAIAASLALHQPWTQAPDSEGALSVWLTRSAQPDFCGLLALRCDDGAPVGVFNLSQIFYGPFCNAYLGYYALMPHAGRGWMRAALPLVLDIAFHSLGLHRLEANIQPDNLASIALIKRTGFRLEGFSPAYLNIGGQWRDHQRWAMLVEEWNGRREDYAIPQPQ